MPKFESTNDLTEEDWAEVFAYPKDFSDGDVVEYINCLWEIVGDVQYTYSTGEAEEKVYKLSKLFDCDCGWPYSSNPPYYKGSIAVASSTYISPAGTFIDY